MMLKKHPVFGLSVRQRGAFCHLLPKFAYANFDLIFGSLRASPLKIPQGALPLDPTTFEKVDKTFNCHSYKLLFGNYTF